MNPLVSSPTEILSQMRSWLTVLAVLAGLASFAIVASIALCQAARDLAHHTDVIVKRGRR